LLINILLKINVINKILINKILINKYFKVSKLFLTDIKELPLIIINNINKQNNNLFIENVAYEFY